MVLQFQSFRRGQFPGGRWNWVILWMSVVRWNDPYIVLPKRVVLLLSISSFETTIWMFPKIGVPQNAWFIVENPIKMDDLAVP